MPQAGLTNSARLSCSWLIVAASLLVICGWLMPAQAAIASEAGGVSGRVTAAASNEPLANIEVCAYEIAPPYAEACKTTAASGEYTLSELPEGRYSVSFASPVGSGLNYVEQTYAQPVTVASGATTPHIDAALAVGAEVTGTVRAEGSKAPIAGVEVCAYQVGEPEYEGFYATCGPTGASGEYTIAGLESGKYKLQFFAPAGSGLNYIAQYYAGKASWEEADAVQLTAGATKSAIDANMATGGEISGQASAAVGGAAIAGLEVCAVPITGGEDGCALTDASGDYTIPGLGTGSYRVEFSVTSQSTSSYLTQFFDDKPSYNEAEPVAVVVGSTTPDINAAMQPGATISGIVTGASKTPLRNVQACAYGDGAFRCATTNTAGEYAITALATGNYTVVFYGTSEYASQYYSGKVYSSEAQSVAATAGSTTPAIDAQLELGGTISGVVSAAATAAPLEDVSVCLFALHNGELRGCTYTNARGEYSLGGLASIEYKVSFSSSGNYLTQYFSAKSTLAEAEPVAVAPGETKSAINAALQAGAQISGIVTSAAGKQPVMGATVTAYTTTGGFVTSATTNVSGAYTLARLPTGTYKVGFSAPQQDLVSEYYEHTPSLGGAAELSVTAGGETTGIDATMQAGGEILGKVTDAATQAALSGVNVEVETTSGEFVTYAVSNADGEYEVSDLHEGSYKVDFHAQDYESQFYDGKIDLAEATTLAVGAGATVEKIDAAMQPLGSLSGEVTDASSHERLSDVEVCDYQQDSDLFGTCTSTNADGEYTFTGLSAGTYEVGFYPGSEYLEQFYNGQASLAEATKITLGQGATVSGISAALQTPGQIKGEVTSKASGLGLAGIEVCAEPVNDNLFGGCAATAADGTYDIADLVGGSYHIVFYPPEVGESSNYVLQFYNDEALKSEARAVSVTAGASTEGIDAALAEGGEIQGTIDSRASKTPIGAADACAYLPEGETYRCGYSNASGDYTIDGLPAGAYVVEFFSTEGEYVQQYYDGVATEAQATRVSVTPGAVTDSIDGTLPADGRIKGVVTSAASGDPLTAIEICLYSGEGVFERCTSTGVSGEYLLGGVSPGKHKVEFLSGSQAYETQYFNGKQSLSEADSVEVSEASTTEAVDAAMVLPGEITGRVTNEGGTTGIAGIQVCAEGVSNFSAGHCASTGANGEYALAALPRGTYRVSFYAPQGLNYIEQYYYDKGLYSEAETVTVTAGAATPNINAEMQVGGEITGQVDAGKPATGIPSARAPPKARSTPRSRPEARSPARSLASATKPH
ncbi:MAG: carboxypeptidase regulatory-like domain-containing protein [Solirubrobacteraceae bacterium]